MVENNQQVVDVNKLIETSIKDSQRTSRISMITSSVSILTSAITGGLLIWKSFKQNRTNSKVRLIRKKGRIDKVRLRQQDEIDRLKIRQEAEMKRELLELDLIEREAKHEAELRELEAGLEKKEEKEIISETDSFINSLKNKGQAILDKKVGEVKKQISKVKDKIPNPLDDKEKNKQ